MLLGKGFRLAALIALSLLAETVAAQPVSAPSREDKDRYTVTLPAPLERASPGSRTAQPEAGQPAPVPAPFPPYPATQPPVAAPTQPPAGAPGTPQQPAPAPGAPFPGQLMEVFPLPEPEIRLFGHDFFDRVTEGFQPIPNLPPPAEYPLGPGDTMEVVLSSPAGQETVLTETVDSEGRLRIPSVGFVRVNGLTIGAAERVIAKETR
ncbi:MAG: polysaccharide biosynthesis/export family protein, partial [Armatimonadota bacterium]